MNKHYAQAYKLSILTGFLPVRSGVEHGNLRELALARMRDLGTTCRDVRTREVGIQEIHHKVPAVPGQYQVRSGGMTYKASDRSAAAYSWSKFGLALPG